MDAQRRLPESAARNRRRPSIEGLESRCLLSTSSQYVSSQVAYARHKYHQYVGELQHVELKSQATAAEYLALRDDARAISEAASGTTLSPQAANAKAEAASAQIDRAVLDGWMGDRGWSDVTTKLTANLNGLNVPPALIDETIGDMKAVASSAGVTSDDFQTLAADATALRHANESLPSYAEHFPDPGLYFSEHLRGFFRGATVLKQTAKVTLNADLHTIEAQANASPSQAAVLNRDSRLLEQIDAVMPSQTSRQLGGSFSAAFAQGSVNQQDLAAWKNQLAAIPEGGTAVSQSRASQLIADAPALLQAVGSSQTRVEQVVSDAQAIVDAGGVSPVNPFKIQIFPTSGA